MWQKEEYQKYSHFQHLKRSGKFKFRKDSCSPRMTEQILQILKRSLECMSRESKSTLTSKIRTLSSINWVNKVRAIDPTRKIQKVPRQKSSHERWESLSTRAKIICSKGNTPYIYTRPRLLVCNVFHFSRLKYLWTYGYGLANRNAELNKFLTKGLIRNLCLHILISLLLGRVLRISQCALIHYSTLQRWEQTIEGDEFGRSIKTRLNFGCCLTKVTEVGKRSYL